VAAGSRAVVMVRASGHGKGNPGLLQLWRRPTTGAAVERDAFSDRSKMWVGGHDV